MYQEKMAQVKATLLEGCRLFSGEGEETSPTCTCTLQETLHIHEHRHMYKHCKPTCTKFYLCTCIIQQDDILLDLNDFQ